MGWDSLVISHCLHVVYTRREKSAQKTNNREEKRLANDRNTEYNLSISYQIPVSNYLKIPF